MEKNYKDWLDRMVEKQNFCCWMAACDLQDILTEAYRIARTEPHWSPESEYPHKPGRYMVLLQGAALPPYIDFAEWDGVRWHVNLHGQYRMTHFRPMPEYHHICLPDGGGVVL